MSEFEVLNPTGIMQLPGGPAINIFPNPSANNIFIAVNNFHPAQVIFYDMDGRRALQLSYKPEIDISSLSSGVYIVEITGAEGTLNKKLIKF